MYWGYEEDISNSRDNCPEAEDLAAAVEYSGSLVSSYSLGFAVVGLSVIAASWLAIPVVSCFRKALPPNQCVSLGLLLLPPYRLEGSQ